MSVRDGDGKLERAAVTVAMIQLDLGHGCFEHQQSQRFDDLKFGEKCSRSCRSRTYAVMEENLLALLTLRRRRHVLLKLR